MKLREYEEMLLEYGTFIDNDDLDDRQKKLSLKPFSVVFEGNYMEFDNVDIWLCENLNIQTPDIIFYGKIDYEYGFIEYFFDNEDQCERLRKIIPLIYTKYFNGKHSKTDGYGREIPFENSEQT